LIKAKGGGDDLVDTGGDETGAAGHHQMGDTAQVDAVLKPTDRSEANAGASSA
jgi:hypothetical protein